jgi:homoserine kinase type II
VALIAAYDAGTTTPLSDTERQALPFAIARQPLWSVGVWAAELDDDHAVATHLNGHDVALQLGRNILESIDRWNGALRQ